MTYFLKNCNLISNVSGQTIPINTCQRFPAPIFHCSFYMIELKELSALTPVVPMEKAQDCGSEGLDKPGFNPQPKHKILIADYFCFVFAFYPTWKMFFAGH